MIGRLLVLGAMAIGAPHAGGAAPTAASTPPGLIRAWTIPAKTGPGVAFQIVSSPAAVAVAKATVYVPVGYGLDLSRAPGSKIGDADSVLGNLDGDFAGLGLGAVTTGDPATLPGDPVAQACAPGPHAAVWILSDEVARQSTPLRFYVDPTSGAESSLGAFKLVVCFDSPYTTGALRALGLEVDLSGSGGSVFTAPKSGAFTWRMFVTPYAAGTGNPDAAATFEARTRLFAPHVLTEHAWYRAKDQKLVVTGRLTALGRPRHGVFVSIFGGASPASGSLGRARTRADGTYSFVKTVREKKRARRFDVWVSREEHWPARCVEASIAPAGCVDESVSPPGTQHIRLTIPRLRKR